MQTKNENIKKRSVILVSAITSLIISVLIIGGGGYFVYNKYLKINTLQKLINDHLKEYVDSGDLNDLIVTKLEQYTGGQVTIEDISLDDEQGLYLNNIKILKDEDAISIKDANITVAGGLVLNEIIRTGKSEADKIMINGAQIDTNNITLSEVAINPSSQITIKNPRFNAEKMVVGYNILDLLKGKFLIKGVTALSSELFLVRRKDGIWLIMDALKDLTDNFNLPVYSDLLINGVVFKNGTFHYIDKDFFPDGVLNVSGIDMVIRPFSGSLKDLELYGVVRDNFFGNYNLTGEMNLNVPSLNIKLKAKDLTISENFVRGMPVIGENIWNTYKPVGRLGIDCLFDFNNDSGKMKFDRQMKVNFNDMQTTYYKWPITVSRVAGKAIFTNNKTNIKNVEGYIYQDGQHGTNIKLDAILDLGKPDKKIIVKAKDIDITEELVKKMPDVCKKLYHTFKPGGRADMDIIYSVESDVTINKDYTIELDCKDWELTYPDLPVPLNHINGKIVISNRAEKSMLGGRTGNVQLKDLNGFFTDGRQINAFSFSGEFDMGSPKKLFYINVPDLNISNEILNNLPKEYGKMKGYIPKGQVGLNIIYDHRNQDTQPNISITADCKSCNFEDSKFLVPIYGVMGVIKVEGTHISAENFVGKCHGGEIKGSIQMDRQDSSYKYNGDFSFFQMDMEDLFRNVFKTNQKWPGLLNGRIRFNSGGNGKNEFNAKGNIILKEGNISDVPIALSIINILNFRLPTKVVFHSGYINFRIKDDIIEIDEAKIYSDTVELVARGRVSFDGRLDVTVIVGFSDSMLKDIPVIGRLVDFVVGGVRKRLTKVYVGGTISEPESSLAMLKPIKKPIKSIFELIPEKDEKAAGTSTAKISE